MIPKHIIEAIETHNDSPPVDGEELLQKLGISKKSQLYEFLLYYHGERICGKYGDLENLEDIIEFEDYLHDELNVSKEFISLTSMEGEGFYLYSRKDNAIYDVDFKDIENLNNGLHAPRWLNFYDFIEDFLSGKDVDED